MERELVYRNGVDMRQEEPPSKASAGQANELCGLV
jgi:hypothetical protein